MKDSRKPPKTKAEKKQENNPFLGPLNKNYEPFQKESLLSGQNSAILFI